MKHILGDSLIGIVGFLIPGGFSIQTLIDGSTNILAFLGLIVSLAVGIASFILICKRIKSQDKQSNIYDKLLSNGKK